jgi:hypothetical protein
MYPAIHASSSPRTDREKGVSQKQSRAGTQLRPIAVNYVLPATSRAQTF